MRVASQLAGAADVGKILLEIAEEVSGRDRVPVGGTRPETEGQELNLPVQRAG
jgi:hypothetical protein